MVKPPKKIRRNAYVNRVKKLQPSRKMPDYEFIENSKAYNCQSVLSKRGYKFYRNNSKIKGKLSEITYYKVCNMFLKELRVQMLNNERGVFIENFGYFGIIKSPLKRITKRTPLSTKSIERTGDIYKPIFLPILKNNSFRQYTMDKGFKPNVYTGIKYRIKKDKVYKLCYTILHNLYGRENNKIHQPIEK